MIAREVAVNCTVGEQALTSSTGLWAGRFPGFRVPLHRDRAWDPFSSVSVFLPMIQHELLRGNTPPVPCLRDTYGPGTHCILRRWEPVMAKVPGSDSSRSLHRFFPLRENALYAVLCISYIKHCAMKGFRNCGGRTSSELRQEKIVGLRLFLRHFDPPTFSKYLD